MGPATWTVAVTVGPGTVRVTVLVLLQAPMLMNRPMPTSPIAALMKGFAPVRRFPVFGAFVENVTI